MWLIGSRASSKLLKLRPAESDWDLYLSEKEWAQVVPKKFRFLKMILNEKAMAVTHAGEYLELHRIHDEHSFYLLDRLAHRMIATPMGEALAPDDSVLKLIKKAHLYWNVKWLKHISDYHQLSGALPAGTQAGNIKKYETSAVYSSLHISGTTKLEKKFYKLRHQEMTQRWGGKFKQHLNQSETDFFGQSAAYIPRFLNHDELHEVVANGPPLFKNFLVTGQTVLLDNEKINEAGPLVCQQLIQEEVSTLTLERYCLPREDYAGITSQKAYQQMYAHFATRMTSGWFREQVILFWPKCGNNISPEALLRAQHLCLSSPPKNVPL